MKEWMNERTNKWSIEVDVHPHLNTNTQTHTHDTHTHTQTHTHDTRHTHTHTIYRILHQASANFEGEMPWDWRRSRSSKLWDWHNPSNHWVKRYVTHNRERGKWVEYTHGELHWALHWFRRLCRRRCFQRRGAAGSETYQKYEMNQIVFFSPQFLSGDSFSGPTKSHFLGILSQNSIFSPGYRQ